MGVGGSENRWRGQAGLCAGQAQGPSEAGVHAMRAERCHTGGGASYTAVWLPLQDVILWS